MSKKKSYKCVFCFAVNTDHDTHLLVVSNDGKRAICTDCVMQALTQILKKIPNK